MASLEPGLAMRRRCRRPALPAAGADIEGNEADHWRRPLAIAIMGASFRGAVLQSTLGGWPPTTMESESCMDDGQAGAGKGMEDLSSEARMEQSISWLLDFAGEAGASRLARSLLSIALLKGDAAVAARLLPLTPDPLLKFGEWEWSWLAPDAGEAGLAAALEAGNSLAAALSADDPAIIGALLDRTRPNPLWKARPKQAGAGTAANNPAWELLVRRLLSLALETPAPKCALAMMAEADAMVAAAEAEAEGGGLGKARESGVPKEDGQQIQSWWDRSASKIWTAMAASRELSNGPWLVDFVAKLALRTPVDKAWKEEATAWNDDREEIVVAKRLTPLMAACLAGRGAMASALAAAGAKVELGAQGAEARMLWAGMRGYAAVKKQFNGHAECLEALLRGGAAQNSGDWVEFFERFAEGADGKWVALIRHADGRIDERDSRGRTALMFAAEFCHAQCVEALLAAGADPTPAAGKYMSQEHGLVSVDALFHARNRPWNDPKDRVKVATMVERAMERWAIDKAAGGLGGYGKPSPRL